MAHDRETLHSGWGAQDGLLSAPVLLGPAAPRSGPLLTHGLITAGWEPTPIPWAPCSLASWSHSWPLPGPHTACRQWAERRVTGTSALPLTWLCPSLPHVQCSRRCCLYSAITHTGKESENEQMHVTDSLREHLKLTYHIVNEPYSSLK